MGKNKVVDELLGKGYDASIKVTAGLHFKGLLSLALVEDSLFLSFKSNEISFEIDIKFVNSVEIDSEAPLHIVFHFSTVSASLCLSNSADIPAIVHIINKLKEEAKERDSVDSKRRKENFNRLISFELEMKQLSSVIIKGGILTNSACSNIFRLLQKSTQFIINLAFKRWQNSISNKFDYLEDMRVAKLHTECNKRDDLMAWYDSEFFDNLLDETKCEVHFKTYSSGMNVVKLESFDDMQIDGTLCSSDMNKQDISAVLFILQEYLTVHGSADIYSLFYKTFVEGTIIMKLPRFGALSNRLFQFSLNHGLLYLSWHGKKIQGIKISTITEITKGFEGSLNSALPNEKCLSITAKERPLVLCFPTSFSRDNWYVLLKLLYKIESTLTKV